MTVLGFRRARFIPTLTLFVAALMARPAVVRANDVTPPIAPPPRPPIIGFVDTHLHQFANLGFGGLEVFGSPVDPTLDPGATLEAAAARALPDSDFIYVSAADALDYLYIGGVPAITTPLAESCTSGCSAACPAGTGVPGNACVKITIHGNGGDADLLNKVVPNGNDSGHGTFGYPDMNGWPAFDVLTTQQAYWEWLERAHDHGMKLMVMLAVNNPVLCQLAMHRGSFGCGDDGSVARQIQGAKNLETYIDARAGGPGQGFYRIVYNSDQARAAIQAGKLAVVLGTEVDTMWGCTPGAAGCTSGFIQDRVQDYYNDGIRVVYPVHLIDNRFGGTAPYTGLFEVAGFLTHGAWFDLHTDICDPSIEWRSDVRQTISDVQAGVAAAIVSVFATAGATLPLLDLAVHFLLAGVGMLSMMLPLIGGALGGALDALIAIGGPFLLAAAAIFLTTMPGALSPSDAGYCNGRGLTPEGATLVNALMDHKMLIDVDHTDGLTFDAILDIAEARNYPGIVSGHTGLIGANQTLAENPDLHADASGRHEANKTDAQVARIMNIGGFLSLGLTGGERKQLRDHSATDGVALDCGRSSQAFAQNYLYATKTLGLTAVGFGSDINGFAGSLTPRFGSKACKDDFPAGYDPFSTSGRLEYATATDYFGAPLGQYTFGTRTWDYNVDGMAHVGLYPDFIADLRAINLSQADLAPMFNAAEAYVRMWEKVDDDEAPTVRCGTVGEDWHADDVVVPCLSFDFGWGLENAADANFSLSTAVANGSETDNASTGTHAAICDKEGNCSAAVPAIAGINVDKKDPTVIVTTPEAGTPTYILDAVVHANYDCSDGGSGVATCAGPVASGATLDTSIGPHPFTVTGADNVAHIVNVPHPYNVSFAICVNYDQTAAHRAGATVPIKIRLCNATGANVSAESIVLTATAVTLVSTSAPGVLEDAGNANPDNEFRFVASGEYVFNLKTTGFATGTYALTFTATGDPIPHQVQFQVR